MKKRLDINTAIQRNTALLSVGQSTVRSQGSGVLGAFRQEFKRFDFSKLVSCRTEEEYGRWLERKTRMLVRKIPSKYENNWGLCRKCLNIFLRMCLYNHYLRKACHLGRTEAWMEVPLDSHVARGLHRWKGDRELPRWKTVYGLEKPVSDQFQEVAREIARERNIHRVHLDVCLWRAGQ